MATYIDWSKYQNGARLVIEGPNPCVYFISKFFIAFPEETLLAQEYHEYIRGVPCHIVWEKV